jgi:hypothetical protein
VDGVERKFQVNLIAQRNDGFGIPIRADENSKGLLVQPSYVLSDMDNSGTVKYYGYVSLTGGWYILREDTAAVTEYDSGIVYDDAEQYDAGQGGWIRHRYAFGETGYSANWLNRSSLYYGLFMEVAA